MADRPLVSMAQQFTGLPMDSLIGAPLNAAAKANASMAVTQTQFILNTGFTGVDDEGNAITIAADGTPSKPIAAYKPIMIKMSLERNLINESKAAEGTTLPIQNITTTFDLPLITIIPINSLGVDGVDITFEMEVKSSFSEDMTQQKSNEVQVSSKFESKLDLGFFSSSLSVNASYDHKDSQTHSTHYQKSNSAKYTVNVHAGQLPVPKGVNTIIEAFTQAITPIEVKSATNTAPSS